MPGRLRGGAHDAGGLLQLREPGLRASGPGPGRGQDQERVGGGDRRRGLGEGGGAATLGQRGGTPLAGSQRVGGSQALRKALVMGPEAIIAEVKASGLRGRGGAGFPTATKWSFLPRGVFPRYLCVNADESEPGCFKDRFLMEEFPHQLLEGVLISTYALQVSHAFIYIRGEYRAQ